MISLILAERCVGCNACVTICPTNVFARTDDIPVIARPEDCQTCFMCELYCRQDAIYVGPDAENPDPVDPAALVASGLLGEFRRHHGWDEWADDPRFTNEHWRMDRVFQRARELTQADAAARQSTPPL